MMRRWHSAVLALLIAIVVHLDWHFARTAHHGLSLGWSQHWLFAAAAFGIIGWLIARRWPDNPWRAAALITGTGIVMAQGVEPVFEALSYRGQLGYPVEPEQWRAFFVCLAAGLPALALALKLCRPRASARDAATA